MLGTVSLSTKRNSESIQNVEILVQNGLNSVGRVTDWLDRVKCLEYRTARKTHLRPLRTAPMSVFYSVDSGCRTISVKWR